MTSEEDGGYPLIEAATLEEFTDAFRIIEEAGEIDSEGGSEWRGTVALWLCRRLGVEPTMEARQLIRDVLAYAEFVNEAAAARSEAAAEAARKPRR
jgi:hypothetical protein